MWTGRLVIVRSVDRSILCSLAHPFTLRPLFQDEITEMKRKLKIMNHQIDQLREEINSKESALVKEHLEFQRVEKEKEALKVIYYAVLTLWVAKVTTVQIYFLVWEPIGVTSHERKEGCNWAFCFTKILTPTCFSSFNHTTVTSSPPGWHPSCLLEANAAFQMAPNSLYSAPHLTKAQSVFFFFTPHFQIQILNKGRLSIPPIGRAPEDEAAGSGD